jgi:hypothetical protein
MDPAFAPLKCGDAIGAMRSTAKGYDRKSYERSFLGIKTHILAQFRGFCKIKIRFLAQFQRISPHRTKDE